MRRTDEPTVDRPEDEAISDFNTLHDKEVSEVERHRVWDRSNLIVGCPGLVYDLALVKARYFPDTSSQFQKTVTAVCDAISPDPLLPWSFALFFGSALAAYLFHNVTIVKESYDEELLDLDEKRYTLTARNTKWFGQPIYNDERTPHRIDHKKALQIG